MVIMAWAVFRSGPNGHKATATNNFSIPVELINYFTLVTQPEGSDESLIQEILYRMKLDYSHANLPDSEKFLTKDPTKFIEPSVIQVKNTKELIRSIRTKAPEHLKIVLSGGVYKVSQTIYLRDNIYLEGNGCAIIKSSEDKPVIFAEDVQNFRLSGLTFISTNATPFFIHRSSNFSFSNLSIINSGGYGIQIDDETCNGFIKNVEIIRAKFGALLIRGGVDRVTVINSYFGQNYTGNLRINNYGAAVRVQSMEHMRPEHNNSVGKSTNKPSSDELRSNNIFSHYIGTRRPKHVLIYKNTFLDNRSQGIYFSGALKGAVVDNLISNSDKEGICIDHQSAFNWILSNTIIGNGARHRQTDFEIKADHIDPRKRMPDGSPKSKLPGVSIDYSDFNVFALNEIAGNHGGGVKFVRSAHRNMIFRNLLIGNNLGDNDLHKFPSMLLGSSRTEGTQAKSQRKVFDNRKFGSSYNIVLENIIYEDRRGILIKERSKENFVDKNSIYINRPVYNIHDCGTKNVIRSFKQQYQK